MAEVLQGPASCQTYLVRKLDVLPAKNTAKNTEIFMKNTLYRLWIGLACSREELGWFPFADGLSGVPIPRVHTLRLASREARYAGLHNSSERNL